MASIKTLNRKRGNVQAQLTKLSSKALDKLNEIELRAVLDSLEDIKNKFESLKQEYFEIENDAEFQQVEGILAHIDEDIQEFQVSAKRFLYKWIETEKTKTKVNVENKSSCVETSVRLPEIPLPYFDGQFNNWNSFKQQFQNIIEENPNLSQSQKFYYLNASLKGAAKQVQSPNDDYDSLFKALTLRYENTKLIVDSHIQSIMNCTPLTKENPTELRVLIDTLQKNIRALKALKFERNNFVDILLINLICSKLDKETHRQFQLSVDSHEVPDWDTFINFLEKRYQILENLKASRFDVKPKLSNASNNRKNLFPSYKSKTFLVKSASQYCILCNSNHSLYKCQSFLKMEVRERFDFCKARNLCLNCLNTSHKLIDCASKSRCIECQQKHHSLLHKSSEQAVSKHISQSLNKINSESSYHSLPSASPTSAPPANDDSISSLFTSREEVIQNFISQTGKTHVILSTAFIYVKDIRGEFKRCRAILDSASQAAFMSSDCATFLGLKRQKINVPVGGLNGSLVSVGQLVNTVISNKGNEFLTEIEFLVVPRVTDLTPSQQLNIRDIQLPSGIFLADPRFFEPSKVDIILGSKTFFEILKPNQIRINKDILLQNTYFGYLVTGSVQGKTTTKSFCHLAVEEINLDKTLRSFWEVEALPEKSPMSDELKICMEHFDDTHTRDDNGRYVVQMPIVTDRIELGLGLSRDLAVRKLNSTILRLERNPAIKKLYHEFLVEYENLGHMEEVKEDVLPNPHYYIPHQAVLRPEKSTTRLRVVFNASAKTSNGFSLNDILLTGGTVQDELWSTLLRFRKHFIAFTADVQKMYRQIKVDPSQRDLLRIVWKVSVNAPVKTYRLGTVTYGTTCAPFLATRTLLQLADDEKDNFPLAAPIVKNDFYIDDVLSGAIDLDTALKIQQQLIGMLKAGGMHLYKWSSNSPELLSQVSTDDQEYVFKNDDSTSVKTLGLSWNPRKDKFHFVSNHKDTPSTLTKRTILSFIAKLYDPLGLVGPLIVKAKIFIQKLWLLGLGWDEEVPDRERLEFLDLVRNLQDINLLNIPRCVIPRESTLVEIHGFADSSEQAYGACIFVRTKDRFSNFSVHLLCSKSRVAPVKRVTLPRLELLGAVLLSKLTSKVLEAMRLDVDAVHLHTDSTIVLSWIRTPPHRLKCFVANRVIQITDLTSKFEWHHVTSKDNPADPLSRGLSIDELYKDKLWWCGPEFLHRDTNLPKNYDYVTACPAYARELVPIVNSYVQTTMHNDFFDNLYKLSNSYLKLIRIISFIFRFYWRLQKKVISHKFISSVELNHARDILVKHAQAQDFGAEIAALTQGKNISNQSKLKFLNPFLDKNKILRVGGRLVNAELCENAKHPIILPKGHKFTSLILDYFHKKFLHVGPNSLLHLVRQQFWPLSGRNQCRQTVHNCITCFKNKPILATQIMGNLPKERVTEAFPFYCTGVDYCGPFLVKFKNQRKGVLNKIYVAVFVCLATRAIHLEIVTELSSDAFIATLKRFFSRRGKCATIFSDNAPNFVKSSKELKKLHDLLIHPDEKVADFLSIEGVHWKFIPPKSPNFGGIWEAGVKSFKFHLKRSIGKLALTLEEFLTVTVQIEGILNSRPLIPLSAEADDFNVLTPGHFLIGRAISAIVEPDLSSLETNRLDKYRKITKIVQNIWKSWKRDYLHTLQARTKWHFDKSNVVPNTVVLVIEENLPIAHWIIGKIVETYPGADGKVRVVKLKLATGNFVKRPISKIAILPIV